MLSREMMGVLALGVLWVNTLLIAGAALKELGKLRALAKRLEALGLARGRVTKSAGSALATFTVEQLGRLTAAEPPAILFHDRGWKSTIAGGELTTDSGANITIEASPANGDADGDSDGDAEVWIDDARIAGAAACEDLTAFERAAEPARKAKGFARSIVVDVREGATVWAARGFVATLDPLAWCSKKSLLCVVFVAVELALAAAVTRAALFEPRFGLVSTLGGAAGLAYFLLVQPAGTWLRDRVRPPSRAFVLGRWARPDAARRAQVAR
jgi:hypothetical protein